MRKTIGDLITEMLFQKLSYRSVKKDYDSPENINSVICSQCKGECCKRCGCAFSPDDFAEISFKYLKKEIEKGYISIDYLPEEIVFRRYGIYILRMRNQDREIVDYSLRGSPCIFLGSKGCKLNYTQRPAEGKLLIPSAEMNEFNNRMCHSKYDLWDCAYEWEPHQKILKQLVQHFENKEISCSI